MADQAAVSLRNVSFAYDGVLVLEGVTLAVPPGDFVAVVGPNGGGKTTLLKIILGLLSVRRGTVRVLGTDPRHARPRVGYVPQHFQFDPQFPMSVMDVVLMGRLRRGWGAQRVRRADREAARRALIDVGIAVKGNRSFAALSGGQRQRVLIARALACDPELILLDEPMAHVDLAVIDELYRLFEELSRQRTVILVSHDVGFVSRLVRRVVCVNRTVTTHPTSEVTGAVISQLYGTDVNLVRHDHDLRAGGEP
jgi:zinc transport system ATP-binding protein